MRSHPQPHDAGQHRRRREAPPRRLGRRARARAHVVLQAQEGPHDALRRRDSEGCVVDALAVRRTSVLIEDVACRPPRDWRGPYPRRAVGSATRDRRSSPLLSAPLCSSRFLSLLTFPYRRPFRCQNTVSAASLASSLDLPSHDLVVRPRSSLSCTSKR